jgi:hypothetical protein
MTGGGRVGARERKRPFLARAKQISGNKLFVFNGLEVFFLGK